MNAYPEGSENPEGVYPTDIGECDIECHDLGFSLFTDEHAARYPLLARALQDAYPACDTRVEWVRDILADGELTRVSDYNWTQIQRHPVQMPHGVDEVAVRDRYFDHLCSAMEETLWDGVRSDTRASLRQPLRTCGGVRELLGREPNDSDAIRLRPLREPRWLTSRYHGGYTVGEWLVEYTLEAVPMSPDRERVAA